MTTKRSQFQRIALLAVGISASMVSVKASHTLKETAL